MGNTTQLWLDQGRTEEKSSNYSMGGQNVLGKTNFECFLSPGGQTFLS